MRKDYEMIHEIRTASAGKDPLGTEVLGEIRRLGLTGFDAVRTAKVYRFEGINSADAQRLCDRIADIGQVASVDDAIITDARVMVEVAYKPGVMNPAAQSLMKLARDMGIQGLLAADSSIEYHFYGTFGDDDLTTAVGRLLVNKTVERTVDEKPVTLLVGGGEEFRIATALFSGASWEEFEKLTPHDALMSLDVDERKALWRHANVLGRDLTDAECYLIGMRWSEHCGHKTFKGRLLTPQGEKDPLIKRLMRTSALYDRGVISAFVDNSGVVYFYDGLAICGKVETHNSPSALEPYGGAATGTGGVLRDILGTGQGAKPIASTDIFCFAPPDFPLGNLPKGCLPPDYLLRRVVAGVGDYGNRMGVPTNNGSVHFHPDFCAKPTVIVGAYGIMPADNAAKGKPRKGDLVVAVGGRTGRDGIHGATFSSQEMTDRTVHVNATAVQIGNAIEERRMLDALLALRDCGLVVAQTDCGAGGFGCAISELGADTGVEVALEKAPLKYPGLQPWEILLSESQERMVLAIRPDQEDNVLEICRGFNVEAVVLGRFTDTKHFVATYGRERVCDLSVDFLEDGLPQRVMVARWEPLNFPEPPAELLETLDVDDAFRRVLAHFNVSSKEPIVRRYDHGVQGTSVLPPFSGVHYDGPNDAAVLRPLLDRPYGLVISHGLDPVLNRVDPYWGSISAGVKALAKYTAVGGNPVQGDCFLIDNFIWPFPDEEGLGSLDLAVDACCDLMHAFHLPFISGKDSLSGTYRSGDRVIKIPPVLCVSAFGRIPNVEHTTSADFKRHGSMLYLIGMPHWDALGGSVLYDTFGLVGNTIPRPDLSALPSVFGSVHRLIKGKTALAVHSLGSGGIAAAVAQMCFGGDCGAILDLSALPSRQDLFNQTPGCFVIEVPEDGPQLEKELPGYARRIGSTSQLRTFRIEDEGRVIASASLDSLKGLWKAPMQEVFGNA